MSTGSVPNSTGSIQYTTAPYGDTGLQLVLKGTKIGGCNTPSPAFKPYRWRGIEGWHPGMAVVSHRRAS